MVLAFPDVYEIGPANLGLSILYDQVNQREDALAERVYCPWTDMEENHAYPPGSALFFGKQSR
jgi:hypothetical protein